MVTHATDDRGRAAASRWRRAVKDGGRPSRLQTGKEGVAQEAEENIGFDDVGVAERMPGRLRHLRRSHVPERIVGADGRRAVAENPEVEAIQIGGPAVVKD